MNYFLLAANGDAPPIVGWLILGGIIWALVAIGQAIDKATKKKPPSYKFKAEGTLKPED